MSVIIAIDGPAGSGKSTLGRALASALRLPYVNTGLMYRALTASVLAQRIRIDDVPGLLEAFHALSFGLSDAAVSRPSELTVDGAPPTESLATSQVEGAVSTVSSHPEIRWAMARAQRELGRDGAVMEGRDIATVIFPDAVLKVFLEAPLETRAARRVEERSAGDPGRLARELATRDARDAKTNAPIPSEDAFVVDTHSLDANDVLALVLAEAKRRMI